MLSAQMSPRGPQSVRWLREPTRPSPVSQAVTCETGRSAVDEAARFSATWQRVATWWCLAPVPGRRGRWRSPPSCSRARAPSCRCWPGWVSGRSCWQPPGWPACVRPAPGAPTALEEQRNGEWRYLEFLQVRSWITAEIFMREIPGGTRAEHRSRPVDLPEHRYWPQRSEHAGTFRSVVPRGPTHLPSNSGRT